MTCKLFGAALLVGAVGLGAFGYFHHTGCCPLTGAPVHKTVRDAKPVSPGENPAANDAQLVKKDSGCPSCCGAQPQTPNQGYFTSLVGKTHQDDGCCGGGCCEGKGSQKTETTVKK